jgi:hypothetical protein
VRNRLRLTTVPIQQTQLDLGDTGFSPGDQEVFADDVFRTATRSAGSLASPRSPSWPRTASQPNWSPRSRWLAEASRSMAPSPKTHPSVPSRSSRHHRRHQRIPYRPRPGTHRGDRDGIEHHPGPHPLTTHTPRGRPGQAVTPRRRDRGAAKKLIRLEGDGVRGCRCPAPHAVGDPPGVDSGPGCPPGGRQASVGWGPTTPAARASYRRGAQRPRRDRPC